jgi:hypothetical protein
MMMQVCVCGSREKSLLLLSGSHHSRCRSYRLFPEMIIILSTSPHLFIFFLKKINFLKSQIFPSLVLCCEAFGFCAGQNEFRTRCDQLILLCRMKFHSFSLLLGALGSFNFYYETALLDFQFCLIENKNRDRPTGSLPKQNPKK